MSENEKFKKCPFCGEQIPVEAIKCGYCGETLKNNSDNNSEANYDYGGIVEIFEEIVKFIQSPLFKTIIQTTMVLGIIICIIWVLLFDYPAAVSNHDKFWYGQYLISGILHTLLAILFALILLLLKR